MEGTDLSDITVEGGADYAEQSHHATAPRPAFFRNGLFKLKLGSVTGNVNRASFAEFSLKQLL